MNKLRIIYLSSTKRGELLFNFINSHNCEIVYSDVNNNKLLNFPDYDIGISFLYTYKIPESEFKKNKLWINFHPGPLPEMKGRNLAFHAIMEQKKYFGATLHYMDKDFDTGNIIEVKKFKIEPHHTAGDLVELSHSLLEEMFKEYVPRILKREVLPGIKQTKGKYYKKEHIENFIELNLKQKKLIRALTVYPKFFPKININGVNYIICPEKVIKEINERY